VEGPLDLRRTLKLSAMWGATPWLKVDEGGAWYARRTPAGPGTVRLRREGRWVYASAWGDGFEHLLDDVPDLIGAADPGFASFEAHHEVVHDLQRRMPGYRQGRTGQVFAHLVAAAVAQKVTGANSKPAVRRIAWAWGDAAPGPCDDLRLLPDRRTLAQTPYYAFNPFGVERRRADLVRRIAARALALSKAAGMSHADARAHLEKLPGIGPWTSGVVVGGPLGDPDAVPIGDYHLPNIVAYNLAGEPRADDTRMLELLAPYAGNRGRVVRALKGAGAKAPRYGAKRAPFRGG